MIAALLAASRGGEPRAAELAREQLPDRYPYVYEFRKALELDPKNDALHRELAYLLLKMSEEKQVAPGEAEREFQAVADASPTDYLAAAQLGLLYLADRRDDLAMPLLKNVLAHGDPATANRVRMALHMPLVLEDRVPEAAAVLDPRVLAERSYQAGFMKDALRYYSLAREADPADASIALKLGWTYNLLHDDPAALHWFDIARHSEDPAVSNEAQRAWKNLRPGTERFRTTLWIYPLYSSRWSDLFGYGQVKTDIRLAKMPFRPYASVRYMGDATGLSGGRARLSLGPEWLPSSGAAGMPGSKWAAPSVTLPATVGGIIAGAFLTQRQEAQRWPRNATGRSSKPSATAFLSAISITI
jgi:tetratricopeptide (TPR) repeat protein